MKIAFFTETYHPQINGVVKSIDLYKKELEKRGHKVYIFAPCPGNEKERIYGFRSMKFWAYPEYRIALPKARLMKKFIETNPDIVHLHGPITAGSMGLSLAKMLGKPIVITYHTHLPEYTSFLTKRGKKVGKLFTIKYVKWFHNRADAVISPSSFIAKELKTYGVRKPIYCIPTGLDRHITDKKIRKKNRVPILLHVGRLCKEKEIDIVIRELGKLSEGNLIITSKGPDERRLKKITKDYGLSKRVKFVGYISDKKRDDLYKKADIFVIASASETQGIVILEAMSYGCPVIARNAKGFKDIIKDRRNGLVFEYPNELHEKINLLLENEKMRKHIIKKGYKTAEHITIENTVNKMEKIYKKLVKA